MGTGDNDLEVGGVSGRATFLYFIGEKVEDKSVWIVIIIKKVSGDSRSITFLYFISKKEKNKDISIALIEEKVNTSGIKADTSS